MPDLSLNKRFTILILRLAYDGNRSYFVATRKTEICMSTSAI